MLKTGIRAAALASVAAFTLATPGHAIDERTFKITQVFAATHWHNTEGIQVFADAVTAASGGKITFEVYHAGQLGKESTTVVNSGLADMGILVPGYETEKLPLTSVVELPGFHTTACEGTKQYWELSKEGGTLWSDEYAKLGVRPLYLMVLPPYKVQTNSAVIASVADMSGKKLRANGAMAKAVAAVGGTPVQVTSNEFYDALSRGTVDGGMWLWGSTRQVGLEDVLQHAVMGTAMGAGSTMFAINENVWQGLDAETQKILSDAGQMVNESICAYLDAKENEEKQWLLDNGKLTLHELSAEEAAKWQTLIEPVNDSWAADMESTGRPGAKILAEYRAISAEMN